MGCSVEWDNETQTVYINESSMPIEKIADKSENINVFVNNEKIIFDDQQPIILSGRTLIPVRYVVEKLGYSVEWNADLQTVFINQK